MSEIKTPIRSLNGHELMDEQARNGIAELSEEIVEVQSIVDKPKIFIAGGIPTTKDNVLAELWYESKSMTFHAYIKIKCQGTSSLKWDKKNFTVTMYQDEERTIPLNVLFPGWKYAVNKYVLKANYIDHTHLRNIVNARLWSEVVASRPDYDTLPVELRNSPNNGAVDGFPIFVYTNGSYQGIYTWNIGKDPWMVGMDESNPNHNMLCNESNTNATDSASNFRALWDGTETNYSYEVGEESDAVKDSMNALIGFVMNNEGSSFRSGIGEYLDVQSAIDYWLHQYVIVGIDGLAKNMLLLTYDNKKRYLSAYDMDSTWCLWWDGTYFIPATRPCPGGYQETRNLLFERLNAVYMSEIKQRYRKLRRTVYTESNIMTHMERFYASIGEDVYADDLKVYPDIPLADRNNIWQLRVAVRDRLAYCDYMILGSDVESIDGDGASWVNTGIMPDNDMLIDITYLNPEYDILNENIFGGHIDDMIFRCVGNVGGHYYMWKVNGADHITQVTPDGRLPNGSKRTLSFDTSVVDAFTPKATIHVFTALHNSNEPWVPGTFRLYAFKITRKSTSEVLLDLVPSIDANGIPCLYDKVGNVTLYNGGTGKLTANMKA